MSTPNINLKSLEFDQIKNELVTYIKSKNEFTDYNFEGSALSTIIDLLSYNTFYQILFQNILVNEMFLDSAQKLESIISHAKVQGYVVPGKTSSVATLSITSSTNQTIPAYTQFRGQKTNGEVKFFYNIKPVILTADTPSTFDVYEGIRIIRNTELTLDTTTQSVFIPETDIEFKSLKVTVDGVDYAVATSVEPNTTQQSKVCFLERRATGYDVMFAGVYDANTGIFNSANLQSTANIRVTYVVPSGTSGNGVSSFTTTLSNITNIGSSGLSSTGTNEPSIESLKFAIPRVFSSQSRVVTKDDVKAFLLERGYVTSFDNVTVTGGDELTSPQLGKVFYTTTPELSEDEKNQATNALNEKCIVGIVFEYGTGAVAPE